jgi:DNA-binding beta-propeller fold protein YncE
MHFLPAIPWTSIPEDHRIGGVAVNVDGTLIASTHLNEHCVYIYNVVDLAADSIVVGVAGTAGSLDGQFRYPALACFVHRNGADTLIICDCGNDRVVEVTSSGLFLRAIAMKIGSHPWGVAYCGTSDVIAVSLSGAYAVILLQYESGAVKREVTIGSGTGGGCGDGQLHCPMGVTFTLDCRYIVVADYYNNRVSKFSGSSGAFIAHVATKAANGILWPRDVLQCEDGSILVAQGEWDGHDGSLVYVGEDGVTVKNIIIPKVGGGAFLPFSLCLYQSLSLYGVIVKTFEDDVFFLQDAWVCSSRSAWLSALSCR